MPWRLEPCAWSLSVTPAPSCAAWQYARNLRSTCVRITGKGRANMSCSLSQKGLSGVGCTKKGKSGTKLGKFLTSVASLCVVWGIYWTRADANPRVSLCTIDACNFEKYLVSYRNHLSQCLGVLAGRSNMSNSSMVCGRVQSNSGIGNTWGTMLDMHLVLWCWRLQKPVWKHTNWGPYWSYIKQCEL